MLSLLPLIIPFISILVIAIFYALSFDRKVNESLFLASVTIVFILYICGLFNFSGSLLIGYLLVLILVFYALFEIRKKYINTGDIFKKISLKTGILTFFIFLVIALLINYGRLYYVWDEFTHWGAVVKHMYFFDALSPYQQSTLHNKYYLPGISIFQYFWTRPFPVFTEYPAFVASNMLFFSLVATFINKINFKTITIMFILLLVPLTFDYNHYNTLYVDSFLGVFFAAAILFYFYFRYEESTYGILMVASALGMLTISKEVGMIFSFILILIIASDLFFYKREAVKEFLFNTDSRVERYKKAFILGSPAFIFLFTLISWRLLLTLTSVRSSLLGIVLEKLIAFRDNIQPHQEKVISAFKIALIDRPLLPFGLSYLHILLAVILIIIMVMVLSKKSLNIKRMNTAILISILGSLVYMAARFIFYLVFLGETAGPQLASFERYVFSYLSGIIIALPIYLFELPDHAFFRNGSNQRSKSDYTWQTVTVTAIIFLIILSLFFLPANLKSRLAKAPGFISARLTGIPVETTIEGRKQFNKILNWSTYLDKEKRYYLVAQGHEGYSMRAFNYILYPHVIFRNSGNVAIYPPEGDANEWGNYILKEYEYLYLFEANHIFKEAYGHFFDYLNEDMLYKVTSDANGELSLLALER